MGLTVYGGGGKPEEEKTVTAGTSVIEVNPSSGKVMKKVTVNPTPTESKSVTPTTSELTVTPSEGKHLSQVVVGAVEDVTPEVTAQTPVITQIAENLGVTITTPSGTNKQILQGNNANLLNIKNNAKKEGLYVWKKLTADGGTFVDYVVDNNESKYPDGGTQGGYWYEKVKEGIEGVNAGEITITAETKTITIPHNLGVKPKLWGIAPAEPIPSTTKLYNTGKPWVQVIHGDALVYVTAGTDYDAKIVEGYGSGESIVRNRKYFLSKYQASDENNIIFSCDSSESTAYFPIGTYKWFAFA